MASAPKASAYERALARSPAQAFRHGLIQSIPFLLVILPFGVLFGVVANEAGLEIAQIMGFSVLVLAGASQFTAVQLISDQAPALVVVLLALVVNLRMAMYSASLVPWLGKARGWQKILVAYTLLDQNYALSIQHYERYPRLSVPQRFAYFAGTAVTMCLPWMAVTWLGATLGNAMGNIVGLDFALPITFISMFAPMLRSLAHVTACAVAITGALLLAGLPSGLGLLIAAPIGMAAGAGVETLMQRRKDALAP
ncbi:AzlC family ABC transporter permease [Paracoccus sp. (in: a-proteobacteria)]|uniref:AzlC family ABC transporter permease n=1 Tax=Paracoccus sp. TaxID=267 RepID=UPI003A893DE4